MVDLRMGGVLENRGNTMQPLPTTCECVCSTTPLRPHIKRCSGFFLFSCNFGCLIFCVFLQSARMIVVLRSEVLFDPVS